QQVRAFLAIHGVSLAPWSGLRETYAELYALLGRRRDDATFWGALAGLLRQVVPAARLAAATAASPYRTELLDSWDIEDLVRRLRSALPGGESSRDASAVGQFTAKLPAAVLGGFLLLGLAASGCNGSDTGKADAASVDARPVDAVPPIDTPQPKDAQSADSSPVDAALGACELASESILRGTIEKSSLSEDEKAALCQCFVALNKSWSDGLTSLFETGSPEEIAAALERLLTCCSEPGALDSDYQQVKDKFLADVLCPPVAVYKGVSFESMV
ncbi:MAG: hypothetical protein V2A73_10455, partial [Pseudomonadota bacterium]